jgi:hypothetical protein
LKKSGRSLNKFGGRPFFCYLCKHQIKYDKDMKKVFLFVMSMLLLSGNVMAQEQTPDGLMDMPPGADGPKSEADTK